MSFVAGLVLLGVLIVVHELGHFLVAKFVGVRVLTFSIGFGPRLFGFQYKDTQYQVCAIPLGGYVRMFGEQFSEDIPEEEKKHSFLHQAIWKKSLIAFAGPFFNLVLPVILFFGVAFGMREIPLAVVGTVLNGSPAQIAGVLPGDKIYQVNHIPVDNFITLMEQVGQQADKQIDLYIKRSIGHSDKEIKLSLHVDAESTQNPIDKAEKVGRIGVLPIVAKPQVALVNSQSAAYQAGLRTQDVIVSVNEAKVSSMDELMRFVQSSQTPIILEIKREGETQTRTVKIPKIDVSWMSRKILPIKRYAVLENEITKDIKKLIEETKKIVVQEEKRLSQSAGISFSGNMIKTIAPDSPAQALGLMPGDRVVAVDGEVVGAAYEIIQKFQKDPKAVHVIAYENQDGFQIALTRLKELQANKSSLFSEEQTKLGLGVGFLSPYENGPSMIKKVGLLEAFSGAFEQTAQLIVATVKSLWMLISFKVPASQLGGPIAIFGIAGEAAQRGFEFYAFVMAMISVNLGLLNLLPIPVLDGGHLLLFGIEAVQRKPLSIKTRETATRIGLFILLTMMMIAIFNDVTKIFGF